MKRILLLAVLLVFLIALLHGCSGDGGSGTPPIDRSVLYVVSEQTNSIVVINNARTADGDAAAGRIISSGTPTVNGSNGVALDSSSDTLYLANFWNNNILVYSGAASLDGKVQPGRIISSSIGFLSGPRGPFLDTANDRLYVTGQYTNNVAVYNNAGTISGNVVPDRVISSGTGTFFAPIANPWVDLAHDRLYVTGYSSNNIVVYNNASTINGVVQPDRIISSATTTLLSPSGIWLDEANDRLYVVCDTPLSNIVVYDNASTISGNVEPARIISGSNTLLNGPMYVWLDSSTDELYVSNLHSINSVLVFGNASTMNGNVAPARVITNVNTGVGRARGLWLVH